MQPQYNQTSTRGEWDSDDVRVLKDFYFTFGHGQPNFGCYHVIKAENENKAREIMFRRFGKKWSMMYKSAEDAGVEEYNLKQIS